MSVRRRTKPVRIFEADHAPLRLLAELERRSTQEVFHAALSEYLEAHRDRLAALFGQAQQAIANGDLDALTAQLNLGPDAFTDGVMARLPVGR